MSKEIKIALIGAAATIIAALITTLSIVMNSENPDQKSSWIKKQGEWRFNNNIIVARGFDGFNKYYNTENFSDFTYEVELNKNEHIGPLGIVFRYNDKTDEGYLFLLWPYGGYQLSALVLDQRTEISGGKPSFLNEGLNVWNKVRIVCNDENITLFINDNKISTYKDFSYSQGKLGLCIHGDPKQKAEFKIITPKLPIDI